MPQFYAYIYRDPSRKNEPIYVGKGQGRRARSHLKRADMHPFTQRLQLMKANGIEPIIQILPCESEELAFLAEEEAIDKFGRKDLGRGTLLNLTDGGEGASNPSAETRTKLSAVKKGENNPFFGKSHSADARAKLSEVNKGENNPNFGKSASSDTRQKQSSAQRGENHPMYGKSPSADTRQKQSSAQKDKVHPKTICPHCGKEGGVYAMKRWHFDKCKQKRET